MLLTVSVDSLSRMSLGKKLQVQIEGKQTKHKTLKSIKWMQKKQMHSVERPIHLVCDMA